MDTISNAQTVIKLLWTGGWDSTYRLVELSRMDVTVQPIYGCDGKRDSMEIEKQTMEKILAALQSHPGTRAHLLPIVYVSLDTIPENPEITQAYQTLKGLTGLGGQYEWLARLALVHPGMELGIVKVNHENFIGCSATIERFGALKEICGATVLDQEHSTRECALVLGNFRFPIIHITEDKMLANIRAWGYEDIMAMIWFCHRPIHGKPCGMCRPCQQKMEGRMEFLLPPEGRRRYAVHRRIRATLGEGTGDFLAKVIYKLTNS